MGAITVTMVAPRHVRTVEDAKHWYDGKYNQSLQETTEADSGDLNTIMGCKIDTDHVFENENTAYRTLNNEAGKGEAIMVRLRVNLIDVINQRSKLFSQYSALTSDMHTSMQAAGDRVKCGSCGSMITTSYVLHTLKCQVCCAGLGCCEDKAKLTDHKERIERLNTVIDAAMRSEQQDMELWYLFAVCAT